MTNMRGSIGYFWAFVWLDWDKYCWRGRDTSTLKYEQFQTRWPSVSSDRTVAIDGPEN